MFGATLHYAYCGKLSILLSCLDESMNFKRLLRLLHGLFAAQSQSSCYNRYWRWDRRCCRHCNQLLTVFSLHFRKRALSSWTCPRLITHHTILALLLLLVVAVDLRAPAAVLRGPSGSAPSTGTSSRSCLHHGSHWTPGPNGCSDGGGRLGGATQSPHPDRWIVAPAAQFAHWQWSRWSPQYRRLGTKQPEGTTNLKPPTKVQPPGPGPTTAPQAGLT